MRRRLWRRWRYLWGTMDPAGIEIVNAILLILFGVVLARRGGAGMGQYTVYALLYVAGGLAGCAGALIELRALRVVGLLLGILAWVTFTVYYLLTIPGSISWILFAALAASQLWCVWRVLGGGCDE